MASQIHSTAEVSDKATLGDGTIVWHGVQIREGARLGRFCRIGKDAYIDADVVLGDRCKVQNFATIYKGVTIGNRVFIGPHVCFTNDLYPRADSSDWDVTPTIVEDGASIGANATILCGIRIGRRATRAILPATRQAEPRFRRSQSAPVGNRRSRRGRTRPPTSRR